MSDIAFYFFLLSPLSELAETKGCQWETSSLETLSMSNAVMLAILLAFYLSFLYASRELPFINSKQNQQVWLSSFPPLLFLIPHSSNRVYLGEKSLFEKFIVKYKGDSLDFWLILRRLEALIIQDYIVGFCGSCLWSLWPIQLCAQQKETTG